MEVKVEENADFPASTSIVVCNMCLSTDRRTYGVESVSYAYGLMTDWAPQDGARVCWECRALLARLLRFKVQALRAKEFLETANVRVIGMDILSGKCMSQLSVKKDFSFSAGANCSRLPEYKPRKAKSTPKKPEVKPDSEDDEVGAEDLPDCDVKPWEPVKIEVEVPRAEVKAEEPAQKKRPRKAKVKEVESEVKSLRKSEVKRGLRKGGRRVTTEAMIEVFTMTVEQLNTYRENALRSIARSAFACKMCVEGFKYEESLQKHNRQFHSEEAGTFVCEICSSRFKSQELLTHHRSKHFVMYRCRYPGCSYMQHMRRNVRTHYAWHTEAEVLQRKQQSDGDMFECDQCGKGFTFRRQLVDHIRSHNKKHLCELCSFRCSNLTQLKMHMLAHQDPSHRKYECEQCHKRFIDRLKLIYHIRTHTGERPFQCETCGAKFIGKEQMTRHIKLRHNRSKAKKTFSQPRTKSRFINNCPGYQASVTATKDPFSNKYECDICKKQITTLGNLRKHYYVHADKNLKCEECEKLFKDPLKLQLHVRSVHKGEKPHQCNICGGRYATKTALDVHLISHSDEKPFKCEICNGTFKYKANLWSHKLIHTGEKPYRCNVCSASFTLKGNLAGHMKIHTNERPFECKICGKKFAWNRNLNNHLKTHAK